MKSDRLITLLLALQSTGKRSAPELAAMLEVSQRTIYRDIDALSAAGVPVYAERGSQGGIVLADAYRDALGRFDEGELQALFVSSDDVLADVGLLGRRGSALAKIANALPLRERAKLERGRGRVHVDARRWVRPSQPGGALLVLREAVWDDRRVSFTYTGRDGVPSERTVDPFGLVAKAGVWYLMARDGETMKTFRVQRIADPRIRAERFSRPPGFDIAAHWERSSAWFGDGATPFVACMHMTDAALANARTSLDVRSHAELAGSSPRVWSVQVVFPHIEAAVFEMLGLSGEAIAIDPPELRERLAARGRALVERYAPPEGTPGRL